MGSPAMIRDLFLLGVYVQYFVSVPPTYFRIVLRRVKHSPQLFLRGSYVVLKEVEADRKDMMDVDVVQVTGWDRFARNILLNQIGT
ncbi:unnamed protein product [Ilex paraguariensis]|uniref:Uncharacterized protein n=1 Tax=Ilex paraguariensis TaxID=185542 RepID=A0ABC8TLE7_9AQUA